MLSIRSLGGDVQRTDPGGPSIQEYLYNDYIKSAPYIRSILDFFGDDIRTARISAINPGEKIGTHCDTFIGFQFGQVRLHVPVLTNDDAKMIIDGEESVWRAGEFWFGDFSKLHSAVNNGDTRRIHLILDVFVTDKLLTLFPDYFVQELDLNNVLFHKSALAITRDALERFECKFRCSAALLKGVFETDDGIDASYTGEIKIVENGELQLFLLGKPLFGLQPISDTQCKLKSWSMERIFEFKFTDNTVNGLFYEFHDGSVVTRVQLPVYKVMHNSCATVVEN